MAFLEKFDKFNRMISSWLQWVGFAGLLVIVFITCIDVVGSKLFRMPVFGSIDIAMLAQLVAISFAAAYALIIGRHVKVEFFMVLLPKRVQAVIDSIIHLLGLFLFILIVWRLCVHGYSYQMGNEETSTARIPLYPFAYGAALASIPVCLILIQRFLDAIVRIAKK